MECLLGPEDVEEDSLEEVTAQMGGLEVDLEEAGQDTATV
jgi:hypothetical protein